MKNTVLMGLALVGVTLCASFARAEKRGDSCTVVKTMALSPPEGEKKKVPSAKPGALVLILDRPSGGWVDVSADGVEGRVKLAVLRKLCKAEGAASAAPAKAAKSRTSEPKKGKAGKDRAIATTALPASTPAALPSAEEPVPAAPPDPALTALPTLPASPAPVAAASAASPVAPAPEPEPVLLTMPRPDAAPDDGRAKLKVAVMALKGSEGMPIELMQSLSGLIPEVLEGLGPFKAITSDDIAQMLQLEALKQSLGCDQVSCLAEIGGAIGADFLVTGSVLSVGGTYLVQLQLANIKAARIEQRVSRDYAGGPKGLLDEVRVATKLLVREVLAQRSGTLLVQVSEEGASIKVDGSIVGVSPLPQIKVAGGTHTVSIEKEGFVVFTRDVDIDAHKEASLIANLLPSEDFKRRYVERASFVRTLAWSSVGVGVLGIGTGVGLYIKAGSDSAALTKDIEAFNEPSYARTASEEDTLNRRRAAIGRLDGLTTLALGVGAGALATGVLLYVMGDSPDRFEATTSVSVGTASTPAWILTLLPNGVGLAGTF